ncbi:hypothetical protein [Sporosarcina sp. FSL K6-3457]|uniref:hypothetical protein n=1 Tax=Sporosarcina sp. FSL K6-3457 TaxID=2978204 RepID=UPI0030FB1F16
MKKILKIITFFCAFSVLGLVQGETKATENSIVNSSGIEITQTEYENLEYLGFTELAIDQMSQEIFDENKDLTVESKSDVTKYYEIQEITPTKAFSVLTTDQNPNYKTTELTEEEYFKRVEAETNSISIFNNGDDTTSTSYRRLNTNILKLNSTTYRIHSKFVWDKLPVTRSYDVLSTTIDSLFTPIQGTNHGQQLYAYTHPVQGGFYGSNVTYNSSNSNWNKQGAGYGLKMNLIDNTSTLRLTQLEGYAYYNIQRSSSVVPNYINAFGNYSHAKNTVSNSISYSLSYGGPAIGWSNVSSTEFDAITTHAQLQY